MRLDLTREGALSPEQARRLESIAEELRAPFHALMAGLAAPHAQDLDWWVTQLASRNTFSSDFYLRCCQAVLAKREAAAEVVVDSPGLAQTLERASVPVRCTSSGANWLRRVRAFAAALYSFTGRALAARLVPSRKTLPLEPLTLVDTFVFADSARDHYYPGMLEQLSESERALLWFVPTLYRVRNHFALIAKLREAPENFLLPEDYLGFGDYLHALAHPWRAPRAAPGPRMLAGIDVEPLVREAEARGFAASGTLEAVLRRRFAHRLRERGVRLRMVLEWYENQELDRGAVSGLREAYPDVPVIGYQGYVVSRHYLCMFPTREEQAAGLIPQSVAVVGPAFIEPAKEFCPGLEVEAAPAFRFRKLHEQPPPREFNVLVALPIHLAEARFIVQRLPRSSDWRITLKPHPLAPLERIGARLGDWQVVSGDLDELIAGAAMLVSSASSACVQAIACGVPVAVMGSLQGLTQNPIPPGTDRHLWTLCYTGEELEASIRHFAGRPAAEIARDRATGRALRERFFTPVNRATVAKLLRLP
jgi:hypothetical protein